MKYKNDLAIIIVNRDRPDLTDNLVESFKSLETKNSNDIYVIEMGSQKDNLSKYCSYHYEDPQFRGKAFGHNQGLDFVLKNHGRYRYYWFLMNDLIFKKNPNPVDTMIEIMENEPKMGILSPTEPEGGYADCKPYPGSQWHRVSTTDYLALLMKDECLREVGFLGPHFKYSWGAIHELTYNMYKKGWFIAYCDQVSMKHLGGTTYGATKNTISRDEYKKNASKWCAKYFVNKFGENWSEEFSKHLPEDVKINTYERSRNIFEQANIHALIDEFVNLTKEVPDTEPFVSYLLKNVANINRDIEARKFSHKEKLELLSEKKNLEKQVEQKDAQLFAIYNSKIYKLINFIKKITGYKKNIRTK